MARTPHVAHYRSARRGRGCLPTAPPRRGIERHLGAHGRSRRAQSRGVASLHRGEPANRAGLRRRSAIGSLHGARLRGRRPGAFALGRARQMHLLERPRHPRIRHPGPRPRLPAESRIGPPGRGNAARAPQFVGHEKEQCTAALPGLNPAEQIVYRGLGKQRWGVNVRLEQERISWSYAALRPRWV